MRRALGLVVLVAIAWPGTARALPVFARRYQASCSTCHTQFPKLNPFGEAFRRNGYQFPAGGDSDAIQQAQLKVVADARRAAWPRSFWPSEIPNYIPLAFLLESAVPIYPDPAVRPVGEQTISLDRLYAAARLLLAARLGRDVSIWADASYSTDGGFQLDRGALVFSNLIRPSLLHIKIGQFEPQVFSFSNYRRPGGPEYLIVSSRIQHGNWNWNIVRGLDLSGTIGGRFGYNLGYGQGVEGAYNNEGIRQVPRDGYARLYFKLGGLRLDGVEPAGAVVAETERSVQVGGFVYAGKHDVDVDNDRTKPPESDVLYKTGGDLYVILGTVELLAAAAYEAHQFKLTGAVDRTQLLGEVSWRPLPWMAGILRAELELSSGNVGAHLTPILSFHPRINLKVQIWAQVEKQLADNRFHLSQIDLVGRYAF
jgi:hypothetical protein